MQQADSTRYQAFPSESTEQIREETSYVRMGEQFDIAELIRRIQQWIYEKLGLSDVDLPGFEFSYTLLFWLIIFIVAGVVVYFIVNARFPGLMRAGRFAEAVTNPFQNEDGSPIRPDPDALLKSGDYRYAVRLLHNDTLNQLDEKGVIRLHPNKTNAEYVSEIRDAVTRRSFGSLSNLYVYAWFGGFYPERYQLEEAIRLWERLTGGTDKTAQEGEL